MKKVLRITESDLHKIVEESVKKILKEANWSNALTDPNDVNPFENDEDDYDRPDPLTAYDRWRQDNYKK